MANFILILPLPRKYGQRNILICLACVVLPSQSAKVLNVCFFNRSCNEGNWMRVLRLWISCFCDESLIVGWITYRNGVTTWFVRYYLESEAQILVFNVLQRILWCFPFIKFDVISYCMNKPDLDFKVTEVKLQNDKPVTTLIGAGLGLKIV